MLLSSLLLRLLIPSLALPPVLLLALVLSLLLLPFLSLLLRRIVLDVDRLLDLRPVVLLERVVAQRVLSHRKGIEEAEMDFVPEVQGKMIKVTVPRMTTEARELLGHGVVLLLQRGMLLLGHGGRHTGRCCCRHGHRCTQSRWRTCRASHVAVVAPCPCIH